MQVDIRKLEQTLVLSPVGRIDTSTATEFERTVTDAIGKAAPAHLVFDCSNVAFVSSAGLRVFLKALQLLKAAKGRVSACGLQPQIKQVFDVTGMAGFINIKAALAECVADK